MFEIELTSQFFADFGKRMQSNTEFKNRIQHKAF